jgi:GntR family transcriptional regulator
MANPKYRQIAEDLRKKIDSGELESGQQLRTELELRERYSASRNTVRDAIKWLTSLGLVETRPGQGTFVVRKIDPYVNTLTADPSKGSAEDRVLVLGPGEGETYREEVEKSLRKPEKSDPEVKIQKASGEVAGRLGIDEGSDVVSRRQERYIDETPWSLETSFYPMAFVIEGANRLIQTEDIKEGTVRYLADSLGRRQVGYRDWISVRAPDQAEATFFKVPQDGRVGVFEIFRTAFDQTGTPTRLTVSLYPTDRNRFVVDVGEVPVDGAVRVSGSPDALAGPLTPTSPAHVTS